MGKVCCGELENAFTDGGAKIGKVPHSISIFGRHPIDWMLPTSVNQPSLFGTTVVR